MNDSVSLKNSHRRIQRWCQTWILAATLFYPYSWTSWVTFSGFASWTRDAAARSQDSLRVAERKSVRSTIHKDALLWVPTNLLEERRLR